MLRSSVKGDVFFDSADSFLFKGLSEEGVGCEELGMGFWRDELKSVRERRHVFFQKLGLDELNDSSRLNVDDDSVEFEVQRVRESADAPSSSFYDTTSGVETAAATSVECLREENGNANAMVEVEIRPSPIRSLEHCVRKVLESSITDDPAVSDLDKVRNWWKKMASKRKALLHLDRIQDKKTPPTEVKTKVQVKKKKVKELSALYTGQEFRAHQGGIWAAKFSPDGKFLATGGQDGVVRVWRITSTASREKSFSGQQGNLLSKSKSRNGLKKEEKTHIPVLIPAMVFHIEESPLQEFYGHTADVLDLNWSNSNGLLSSSSDSTARLWKVGSCDCVHVFHHSDVVTCVQFNPVDDGYFISGSVDGRFRLWSVSDGRVVDWDDVREPVTAISYQPDGQGLVIGCLNGRCRFYEASGGFLQLISQVQVLGNKKSSENRITGIQFLQEDSQKVMITSDDSRVRVIDKNKIIHKYRGLFRSGYQMSASFTPNQRHIISVDEDSNIYLWDYNSDDGSAPQSPPPSTPSSAKHGGSSKSVRSCEYFHSRSVSVVLPWSTSSHNSSDYELCSIRCSCSRKRASTHRRAISSSSDSSIIGNLSHWFSPREGSGRATATWPEELLSPVHHRRSLVRGCNCGDSRTQTWGLVIVTGGFDGTIKVFHNYGLPIKV